MLSLHCLFQATVSITNVLTKLILKTSKTLIYSIKKSDICSTERVCDHAHALTEYMFEAFYTQISFISVQKQKMPSLLKKKITLVAVRGPKQLVCNLFPIQCAAATENVTCCHHTFKIRCSFSEFSTSVDLVKGRGLHICSVCLLSGSQLEFKFYSSISWHLAALWLGHSCPL